MRLEFIINYLLHLFFYFCFTTIFIFFGSLLYKMADQRQLVLLTNNQIDKLLNVAFLCCDNSLLIIFFFYWTIQRYATLNPKKIQCTRIVQFLRFIPTNNETIYCFRAFTSTRAISDQLTTTPVYGLIYFITFYYINTFSVHRIGVH